MRTALINLPSKKDVLINDYDMIIAEEVIKANGHVVNTVELLGYIALFQNPSDAVVCAQTVQQELNETFPNTNNQIHHIVALENGPVKRIWRAHGIDYFGTAIEAVESLAKYAMTKNCSSIVFMSERFRSQWLLETDPNHVNKATNFVENQLHDGTPIWELLIRFKMPN